MLNHFPPYKAKANKHQSYLIIPPCTSPLLGSSNVVKRSWIISSRWAWAETVPLYFVTQGQSMEATTYTNIQQSHSNNLRYKKYVYISHKKKLTAAIEGLESSPGCGCVTSAPKIIVGLSLTWGILLSNASLKTVFRPPTYMTRIFFKFRSSQLNLDYSLDNLVP